MSSELDDRIEAYLDGELSQEQSEVFERDLTRSEIAEAFGQALMIRELLQNAPPDEAPAALVARIEQAVLDDLKARPADERAEPASGARAVFDALAWTVRGPSLALNVTGVGGAAVSGMGTARFALGPLAFGKKASDKPSVGRRGLRLLGRLVRRK
jgi:anti-sigma factor RsiW